MADVRVLNKNLLGLNFPTPLKEGKGEDMSEEWNEQGKSVCIRDGRVNEGRVERCSEGREHHPLGRPPMSVRPNTYSNERLDIF
jgi:hypothetical protein